MPVDITPATHGTWELLPDGNELWRLRIASPGAVSLNLGFTRYGMPHTHTWATTLADASVTLNAGASSTFMAWAVITLS
jgi:hypothetical protein